jgi:hypothetical protein
MQPYSDTLSAREVELADHVAAIVERKWRKRAVKIIGLFTLLTGFGLWQVWTLAREHVNELVAQKFDEPYVKSALAEAAKQRAGELMEQNLRPDIEAAKKHVNEQVDQIRIVNDFATVVLKADHDDRAAWDQLAAWGRDSSFPLSALAAETHEDLTEKHLGPSMYRTLSWTDPNNDPQKATLERITALYERGFSRIAEPSHPRTMRIDIIHKLAARSDLSKRDRLSFLLRAVQTDQDLTVMEHAGAEFLDLAGLKYRPLDVDAMTTWWSENQNRL